MGRPETLISVQGREFVNELSPELYHITNTDHRITSAYHPQACFGLTERFNQTVSRCLTKIMSLRLGYEDRHSSVRLQGITTEINKVLSLLHAFPAGNETLDP